MSDDKTPETKKRSVRIFEQQLQNAEHGRTVYLYTAPAGATPEDFLEPETFAHTIRLRADDVVVVTAEDRTWRCEVLVLSRENHLTRLAMLSRHEFEPAEGEEHKLYEEQWAGGHAKWRVLRRSDRHVMADRFATKSEATAWIEKNSGLKQAA